LRIIVAHQRLHQRTPAIRGRAVTGFDLDAVLTGLENRPGEARIGYDLLCVVTDHYLARRTNLQRLNVGCRRVDIDQEIESQHCYTIAPIGDWLSLVIASIPDQIMLGTDQAVIAGETAHHVTLFVVNAEIEVHRFEYAVMQFRLILHPVTVWRNELRGQRQVSD